jgi:ParB-like partition proteins
MNTPNKTKKTDIMLVDPKNIVIVGDNIRQDLGDIEQLASSIAEVGIQIPLKGKKVRGEDKFELVDGHRRFTAIQLLLSRGVDIGFIPVSPYLGNSEDRLITMLATGVGQKELTPVEQADGVKKLLSFGYNTDEIAKKIGKSLPHIYHLLKLSEAPRSIKKLIADGKVSANVVVEIIREFPDDEEKQIEKIKGLVEVATERGKTKVTKSTTEKKYVPSKALKSLVDRINNQDEKTEKMEWFLTVYEKMQTTKSIEELVELF